MFLDGAFRHGVQFQRHLMRWTVWYVMIKAGAVERLLIAMMDIPAAKIDFTNFSHT